jgi:cell division cycle 2-like
MATSSRKRFAVGSTEEYEETTCLGKGGFGNVVKARHRATGKFVAIKRLSEPGQRHSAQAVMREAEFLESCVGNPFVVGYHGIVSAPGSTELRIVMSASAPACGTSSTSAATTTRTRRRSRSPRCAASCGSC